MKVPPYQIYVKKNGLQLDHICFAKHIFYIHILKVEVATHEIITIKTLHIDKLVNTEMCTYF
jgi:hypothetical protein